MSTPNRKKDLCKTKIKIQSFNLTNLFFGSVWIYRCCTLCRDKNFGNFGRFFAEISFFGAGGKEIQVENRLKKNCGKIGKIRFFPEKIRFFPKFGVNYSLGH